MKKIILVGAVLFAIIVPILFFTASNDIKYELINQFAPKIVEGVKKLKSWSEN